MASPYVDGRFKHGPSGRHPVLMEAIAALTAEVEASRSRHGPVPLEEWPESADSSWIVFSLDPPSR